MKALSVSITLVMIALLFGCATDNTNSATQTTAQSKKITAPPPPLCKPKKSFDDYIENFS